MNYYESLGKKKKFIEKERFVKCDGRVLFWSESDEFSDNFNVLSTESQSEKNRPKLFLFVILPILSLIA